MASSSIHPFFTDPKNRVDVNHYLHSIINKEPHLGPNHPSIKDVKGILGSLVLFFFKPKKEYEYSLELQRKVNTIEDPDDIDLNPIRLFRGLVNEQVKIDQATHLRNYRSSLVTAAMFIDTGLTYLSAKANKSGQVHTILKIASYVSYVATAVFALHALISWHKGKLTQETVAKIAEGALTVKSHLQPSPETTSSAAASSLPSIFPLNKSDSSPPPIQTFEDERETSSVFETIGASSSTIELSQVKESPFKEDLESLNTKEHHISMLLPPLLSEENKVTIRTLIQLTSDTSLFSIAFKREEMLKLGSLVSQVHPLRFLEFVLTDTELKKSMTTIQQNPFRWNGFIHGTGGDGKGFSQRFKDEHQANNFLQHVHLFCTNLKLTEGQEGEIRVFASESKWANLVELLIKAKCH